MRKTKQTGSIKKHHGWWVLRFRETVGVGGKLKTVQRARRLAPIDAEHKTKASVRSLAEELLEPLNKKKVDPLTITTLGDFCDRAYLPFVKEHKRPSTYRGYSQMWNDYLKERCGSAWLREVKTCHVQTWLETIAREDDLSKTTLKHIKHFLSGVFVYAKQQDFFDRANPVTDVTLPTAPDGFEGYAYSLEEIRYMLSVLSEPAATVVATAAYTGLRLGELRGLVWEAYTPTSDDESFGQLFVTRSIWRNTVGDPKTKKSKAPVPVIPQLAEKLDEHRRRFGSPATGPIFANGLGKPRDLDDLARDHILPLLDRCVDCGRTKAEHDSKSDHLFKLDKESRRWRGWHAFRRGLASNLNRLGVDDSVIQAILRHSTVATTQNHYIKTARPDAVAAMQQFSEALEHSCAPACAPNSDQKPRLVM
jgi:integrase